MAAGAKERTSVNCSVNFSLFEGLNMKPGYSLARRHLQIFLLSGLLYSVLARAKHKAT